MKEKANIKKRLVVFLYIFAFWVDDSLKKVIMKSENLIFENIRI